jgi:hypothetical protein
MKRLVLCVPTITKPYQQCLDAIAASEPLLKAAGWDSNMVSEIGSPYISSARSIMLRKALDFYADEIVFIDHDLSWAPQDLLTLIETPGEVVAGTYRFKQDQEEYMGAVLNDVRGAPVLRDDGCVLAHCIPAGFLKITRSGVNRFMAHYPELCYGERHAPHVDLFNHGAHEFVWYGEDYAFSRRWNAKCGQIWIVPDLNLTHHAADKSYPGNFHQYLLRQPGGSESENPIPPSERPLLKAA